MLFFDCDYKDIDMLQNRNDYRSKNDSNFILKYK